jgi:hypothetical protein
VLTFIGKFRYIFACFLGGLEKDFTVDDLALPCDIILVVGIKN